MILKIYFQIYHISQRLRPCLKGHAVYNSEFISKRSVHRGSAAQLANSMCCQAKRIHKLSGIEDLDILVVFTQIKRPKIFLLLNAPQPHPINGHPGHVFVRRV